MHIATNNTNNMNNTTGKLMINIIRKKTDAQEENAPRRRFITETLEFKFNNNDNNYEQLRNTIDEFVKPFLTEEKPEFIVKGIIPSVDASDATNASSEQQQRNKRMIKKLNNESDFNELMMNLNGDSPQVIFAIKLVNNNKKKEKVPGEFKRSKKMIVFTAEQEQALNEKKQQIDQLKDEIKNKKDQIKVIKLEMKTIRISAKQQTILHSKSNVAAVTTTSTTTSETIPVTEGLQQENQISKEEKLALKLQKKDEKKRFKLEKKMLKAQNKLEKMALKKKLVNTEPNASVVVPIDQQDSTAVAITVTVTNEPTAPVILVEQQATNSEPTATSPVIVTEPIVNEIATTAVNQEAEILRLQKKEEKRTFKMEKKLEKQMIKAQRKLEKQAQKQERKERKLLLKQQASTTTQN